MLKILSGLFALLITASCAFSAASDYKVDNLGQIYGYNLRIRDTDSSHYLIFKAGSNLTADRTFTITTGDADVNLTFPLPTGLGGTGLVTIPAGYIPFGAGVSPLASSAKLTWDDANNEIRFYKDAGHYMTIDHKEIYVRSGDLSINSNYISTPLGYGFLGLGRAADVSVSLWVSNRTKGSGEQVSGYFDTTFSNDADYPTSVYGIWVAPILDTSSVYTSTAIGLKISDFSVSSPPAVSYLHGIQIAKLTAGELGNYQITLGDASGFYESSYTAGTQTGNLRFILPVTRGTAGQAIVTDGGTPANLYFSSLYLNADAYNFTPQAPGGSVTAGVAKTTTLTPCPYGVIDKIVGGTASDHYVYLSGGTGTAEAVRITGGTCTSGAATGTIVFTSVYSHSGAWTVSSATAGIQEAHGALEGGELAGGIIFISPGDHVIYAPISIRKTGTKVMGTGYTYDGLGTVENGYPGHDDTTGSRIVQPSIFGCTGAGTPWACCTDVRVGTCPNPQGVFRIVNCIGCEFERFDVFGNYGMAGETHMTFSTGAVEPGYPAGYPANRLYGATSGAEIVAYNRQLYNDSYCNAYYDPWDCCTGPKAGTCTTAGGSWAGGDAAGDLYFGINAGAPVSGEEFWSGVGGTGTRYLTAVTVGPDHRGYVFVVDTYLGHYLEGDPGGGNSVRCNGGSDQHYCGTTRLLKIRDLSTYGVSGGFIRNLSNAQQQTPPNYGFTSDYLCTGGCNLHDIGLISDIWSRSHGDTVFDLSGFIDYQFRNINPGGSNNSSADLVKLYYSGRLEFTGGIFDFAGKNCFNIIGQTSEIKISNLSLETCGEHGIKIVGEGTGAGRSHDIYISNISIQHAGEGYSGIDIGDYVDNVYIVNSQIGSHVHSGSMTYTQEIGLNIHGSTPDNIYVSNTNFLGNAIGGSHDGSANAATLHDSTKSWVVSHWVGHIVRNTTDGSQCTVTANTDHTVTCTLTGGSQNDWDVGDLYKIDGNAISLTNSNTAAYISISNNNLTGYAIPVNIGYQYTNLRGATNAGIVDFTLSYEAVAVSSRSIVFYEMWGSWMTVSSNYTLTLPSATVGLNGCFEALTAATFVLTPASGENFVLNGVAKAANATISSPATAGNYVCIHCAVAGTWRTGGMNGTFTSP